VGFCGLMDFVDDYSYCPTYCLTSCLAYPAPYYVSKLRMNFFFFTYFLVVPSLVVPSLAIPLLSFPFTPFPSFVPFLIPRIYLIYHG
jgi:hypothetical protein